MSERLKDNLCKLSLSRYAYESLKHVEVIKVLLIEGRARQVLPMSKALRELGCEVTTYNTSKLDPGYSSKYPNRKLIAYFDVSKPIETYNAILQELKTYTYDIIIPLNDEVAILLSKNKQDVEKYANVHVNDWDIFQMASDKLKTMDVCMKNRIPCPLTLNDFHSIVEDNIHLHFPVVCKPRTGCAAVGFHISHNYIDLEEYYKKAEIKYGPCLIQEFIPQEGLQYKAELYIDRKGELKGACVFAKIRWYPIHGGSSTLNEIVDRPDIIEDCKKLLLAVGWKGYADIDLIEDPRDGKAKVMEINPRITGSVKICFEAGVNFAKMILDDYIGNEVEPQFDVRHCYLRYMHTDILWFIKSKQRFSSNPSWFSFKNTADQIFSWSDIWVFFAYTIQGFSKILKDKRKRTL